jgi:hypothetical protein
MNIQLTLHDSFVIHCISVFVPFFTSGHLRALLSMPKTLNFPRANTAVGSPRRIKARAEIRQELTRSSQI